MDKIPVIFKSLVTGKEGLLGEMKVVTEPCDHLIGVRENDDLETELVHSNDGLSEYEDEIEMFPYCAYCGMEINDAVGDGKT